MQWCNRSCLLCRLPSVLLWLGWVCVLGVFVSPIPVFLGIPAHPLQIIVIQRAMAANLTSFMFEGSKIRLKATASVFITMNPNYAGRQELPDNLKVRCGRG